MEPKVAVLTDTVHLLGITTFLSGRISRRFGN